MKHLKRLSAPEILINKFDEWTTAFLASDKTRPDNTKYAHKTIKDRLSTISFGKCFYCETKISDRDNSVDHFIEVADPKGRVLAFSWNNLYFCCKNCQSKAPNKDIDVNSVLDPFRNNDDEIEQHLSFQDACITAKNDSDLGFKTIQKYKLNSLLLDKLRADKLLIFKEAIIEIQKQMIKDNRSKMLNDEINILKFFAQKDQPFSLMFRLLLKKTGIL